MRSYEVPSFSKKNPTTTTSFIGLADVLMENTRLQVQVQVQVQIYLFWQNYRFFIIECYFLSVVLKAMNLLNVILSTHYISNEAYFKSFPML